MAPPYGYPRASPVYQRPPVDEVTAMPADEVVAELDPTIEAEYAAAQAAQRGPQNSLASSVEFSPSPLSSSVEFSQSAPKNSLASSVAFSPARAQQQPTGDPYSRVSGLTAVGGPSFGTVGNAAPRRPDPQPLPTTSAAAPAAAQGERSGLSRTLFPFGTPSVPRLPVELTAFGPKIATARADDTTQKPAAAPPASPPGEWPFSSALAPKQAQGSQTPSTTAVNPAGAADVLTEPDTPKPQKSIEDLRREFNLVEYARPGESRLRGPGEEDFAFGQRYRRLGGRTPVADYRTPGGGNAPDAGRGSYSQMEIKDAQGRDAYKPAVDFSELLRQRARATIEADTARATAAAEDVQQFPSTIDPTTGQKIPARLYPRGAEIRQRQEDEITSGRVSEEIGQISDEEAAAVRDLQSQADFALRSPQDRQEKLDEIRRVAATRTRNALIRAYGRNPQVLREILREYREAQ